MINVGAMLAENPVKHRESGLHAVEANLDAIHAAVDTGFETFMRASSLSKPR
jgi:hypothetical protein